MMEVTPKLSRKSLSLTSRLRKRSSCSPATRHRLRNSTDPSSPISIASDYSLDGTPPHRKFAFNVPYSPTSDPYESPRGGLSQSSTNSPEVTWRWNQDDPIPDIATNVKKSTPNSAGVKELRKKRSVERKEEIRRAELEKRKAIKSKRDDILKKQCEQVELIISKKRTSQTETVPTNAKEVSSSSAPGSKEKETDLFNNSDFDELLQMNLVASEKKIPTSPERTKEQEPPQIESAKEKDLDLLNDSECDGLLLAATQQVETTIERTKKNCTKELERSFEEDKQKEKSAAYEFLQDSFDDWFVSLDEDLLSGQPKKPRTSLQRYKSMPTESPTHLKPKPDTSKIRRYPSSNTLRPISKFR